MSWRLDIVSAESLLKEGRWIARRDHHLTEPLAEAAAQLALRKAARGVEPPFPRRLTEVITRRFRAAIGPAADHVWREHRRTAELDRILPLESSTAKAARKLSRGVAAPRIETIIKRATTPTDPERYLLGIALAPAADLPAAEVRRAAHAYMESGRTSVHRGRGKILESCVVPHDIVIDGRKVRAGTWLLGVRADESLWADVVAGRVTGFDVSLA